MQCIRRASPGLPGLALLGSLALGCGQGEGDRCQINSDCKSGLECWDGTTGNGICRQPGTSSGRDAAPDTVAKPVYDAAPDQVIQPVPDAAPDTIAKPDATVDGAPDASLDLPPAGPEVGPDGAASDVPAIDTEPLAPDASGSEATVIDATSLG